MGPLILDEGW